MKVLYLSGGGARGAYQVGVLKGIIDVLGNNDTLPFDGLCCNSVGAINGSVLASHLNDFPNAVQLLETLWRELTCREIFDDRNHKVFLSLAGCLTRFATGRVPRGHLFDTSPLKQLITQHVHFDRINQGVQAGQLKIFELSAYCYDLAETVSFVCSHDPYVSWRRVRHMSYHTPITLEHVLASTAIPLFFPAQRIGRLRYGDGTLRMAAPLRGALKSGAEKIMIISTRAEPTAVEMSTVSPKGEVTFARVIGSMMNGLFLDNLDRDLEMLGNLNLRIRGKKVTSTHWRDLNVLHLHPRIDIGEMAMNYHRCVSLMIRYLLRVLGGKEQAGDFLSFLLFDGQFASVLIEQGYQDALDQAEAIQAFFESE